MTGIGARSWPLIAGALAAVAATFAHAQSGSRGGGAVRGVISTSAGVPIEGAHLTIINVTAESNERGEFFMPSIGNGEYMLRVRRLGFRPDSQPINVVNGKTAQARFVMEPVSMSLATVTVRGRHEVAGPMAGFYRRRATGSGRFFTSEDIEKRSPTRLTDLLRGVPGLSVNPRGAQGNVRIRGSRCAPVVFLDGHALGAPEFDLDAVDPRAYEGIEVYSGGATVPVEFSRSFRMSSSCGTILLWSKRGETGRRATRAPELTPVVLIARMLDQRLVFVAADVDTEARLDSSQLVSPRYPLSLFETATRGRVLAEFVVSATGEVDLQTFSAVTATHRTLVEAVRAALGEQRFIPAARAGKAVHQVMQMSFEFVPDSLARRNIR